MRREIAAIILLFLSAQALGLFVGKTLTDQARVYSEFESLNIAPAGQDSVGSSAMFILYIVVGAAVFLLILKFYRGTLLYRLMEAGVILVASNVVFYVLLLAFGAPHYVELSLLLSAGLAAAKFMMPNLKNAAAVIASAGVGAIFGFSLNPLPAVMFIIGLSLYDILAVFGTKHMVTMARELGGRNLAFSINAEGYERVRVPMKPRKVKGKGPAKPKFKEMMRRSSLELGTGDISMPLMLAVSALKTGSLIAPLAIVIASAAALYFVLWYVFEKKAFLPALPPLAGAGIAAFVLIRLAGL